MPFQILHSPTAENPAHVLNVLSLLFMKAEADALAHRPRPADVLTDLPFRQVIPAQPEEIGVQLTEGDMMDPEASVSALVLHHSQAEYFSVGPDPS